jgi:hypothetical protein
MATIDNSKKYFFHNIYGDEQSLIDSLPSDVVAIPAGWSEDAEDTRNDYIGSINAVNVSTGKAKVQVISYPTIMYYRNAFTQSFEYDSADMLGATPSLIVTAEDSSQSVKYTKDRLAGWYQFSIANFLTKDEWTWTKINEKIQYLIDNNKARY